MRVIRIDRGQMQLLELPDNSLATLQYCVGGLIQQFFTVRSVDRPGYRIVGYANEEGRLLDLFPNVISPAGEVIYGPVVVVALSRDPEADPEGLTDAEAEQIGLVNSAPIPTLHVGLVPA